MLHTAVARALVLLFAGLMCSGLKAQPSNGGDAPRISLNGSLGKNAAVLVINGEARTLRVGQSDQGIKLISVGDGEAQIETGGRTQRLVLGATQVSVGDNGGPGSASRQIRLAAGPGGHYTSSGTINGNATQFLLDTGATMVSISQQEADRLGLRYREGRRISTNTANGNVPAWGITLSTVRVGGVELRNIDAIVVPSQMSHVLLGNSFLSRFQIRREDDVMTLELRY